MKTVCKAVAFLVLTQTAYGAENVTSNDEKDIPSIRPTLLSLTTLIKPTIKKPADPISYEDSLVCFHDEKKKYDGYLSSIELKLPPSNFKEVIFLGVALMRDEQSDNNSRSNIKKDLRALYKKIKKSDRAEFKKQGYGIFDDLSDSEDTLREDDIVYKRKLQKIENSNAIENSKQITLLTNQELHKKEIQCLQAKKQIEEFEKKVKQDRDVLLKNQATLKDEQIKLLEKKGIELHKQNLISCINNELTKDQETQIQEIASILTKTEEKLKTYFSEQDALNKTLTDELNSDMRLKLLSSLDKKQDDIKKLNIEIQELKLSKEKMELRKNATDYSFSDWARYLTGIRDAGDIKK
ncbi:MAG: hypothetical protein WCE21_04590 [Candidatus Babeliales bacterium]